jgi:hypothetical protein
LESYGKDEPIGSPILFSATRSRNRLPQEALFDPFVSEDDKWRALSVREHRQIWSIFNQLMEQFEKNQMRSKKASMPVGFRSGQAND